MNLKLTVILSLLLYCSSAFAQEAMLVTEQTISIEGNKTNELFYGFAEGDKIVFNFKGTVKLAAVEIVEYPDIIRFSDYNVQKIKNKTITVAKKGVYIFRFKNESALANVCKISIQRIPANEATRNFNSAVAWENRQETTYHSYVKEVVTGYDTVYIQKTKKELISTTLSEDMIINKSERIHSMGNMDNSNKKVVKVALPEDEITDYKTKEMTAWAYWIGVGKESSDAWTKNLKVASQIATGVSYFTGAGPLGKIAIGTMSSLAIPSSGEDVSYAFIPDQPNAKLFLNDQDFRRFDKGKGIAAYGKMGNKTPREFYIGLLNDNYVTGIDVDVKISVIWETKIYEDREYTEAKISPRYEMKQFSEPVITPVKVPVTGF